MNRRYVGFFFIGLGIILLLLIIYFLFFYKFNQDQTGGQDQVATSTATTTIVVQPVILEAKPATKEEISEEEIKRLAASFAERFGSYSNQSNFQNMDDLKLFMTDKMQRWSEDFVKTAMAKQDGASQYYGITSKAITKKMLEYDAAARTATVLVHVQRREVTGQGDPVSFSQAIEIKMNKEGNSWKIDQAYWQER